ncbi:MULTISPECIES: hypothetical protein [Methanocalculus]|uniref:hypothetical protein n=1 Tax=Methanocalculus TaxID=71151 RepID=UPI00209D6D0E|nr:MULTISPECIES: hypothetical protein [unclassified Methanocalculus]MCP1662010.1 NAD-dependent SIR2 family protein deacetylase [Methanocalculus sp. AMF5]
MHETWLCPYCENTFIPQVRCATCGPGPEFATCPRCEATLRRPVRMVFFSGMDEE